MNHMILPLARDCLCVRLTLRARSSVGLERVPDKDEVVGSNPIGPIFLEAAGYIACGFLPYLGDEGVGFARSYTFEDGWTGQPE